MTGVLLFRSIGDLDVFTQIRLGQLALEQGGLISSEPFSYLNLGKDIANPGWLAQVLLALGYEAGGLMFLKLLNAALFALAIILPVASRGPGLTATLPRVLAVLLGFFVLIPHCALRPQTISLLGFALLLRWLLKPIVLAKLFPRLILVFLIWQNSHPSLVLALALLGVFLLSDYKQVKSLVPLMLLALGCQLLTPDGLSVFEAGSQNVKISRTLLGVSEWLSPWQAPVRDAMLSFWIGLGITILLVFRNLKSIPIRDWLLLTVFTGLSLYAARFAAFFALAMIPVWSALLVPFCKRFFSDSKDRLQWAASLCGMLVLPLGFLCGPTPIDASLPMAAIKQLEALHVEGHVYNYREWGGPLTLYGDKHWQIALDGRLYLYGPEIWVEYNETALGRSQLDTIILRHEPAAFFLHSQFHKGLIEQLHRHAEWCRSFQDGNAALFLPCRYK